MKTSRSINPIQFLLTIIQPARFLTPSLLVALVGLASGHAWAVSTNIVISQIYGGGGGGGATYRNDFIELHNSGSCPVDVTGWSVQFASQSGTSWSVTALPNGTILPGNYYLIQEASAGVVGSPLPTPDATGTIDMGAVQGKVALVNNSTALAGSGCPFSASVVDFVGYGNAADCYEGANRAPNLSATTAALRGGSGCTDTDTNSTDFATGTPAPRNSASARVLCVTLAPPTFTLCPTNQNLGCNPTVIPACNTSSTNVAAISVCGTPTITCTNSDSVSGCLHTRTITYAATDANNLSSNCVQVITWTEDTTAPVFTNCPAATTNLGCNPSSIPDCDPAVGATDDCGVATVSCAAVDAANGCTHTRTLTYTAVDNCNNTNTCTQVISWSVDSTPPMITCPPNTTAECGHTTTNLTGVASATDNCGVVISYSDVTAPGLCPTNSTITRTWRATDGCGSSVTCDQIITVVDTTGPVFANCPPPTLVLGCNPASIPTCNDYCWTNFAGSLTGTGDTDGPTGTSLLNGTYGASCDSADNVYIADRGNGKIKKITPGGVCTTVLGGFAGLTELVVNKANGNIYVVDLGASAIKKLAPPYTIATTIDSGYTAIGLGVDETTDTVYVGNFNQTIRKITSGGIVTVIAGNGTAGLVDGPLLSARFNNPCGIAVDAAGNLYVADRENHSVRYVNFTSGMVTTVAGNGSNGCADGTGGAARFTALTGVTLGPDGNIYVADQDNFTVRKLTPAGVVTTLGGLCGTSGAADGCGTAARFGNLGQVAVDSALNIYTADRNGRVAKGTYVTATDACGTSTVTCAQADATNGCAHTRTLTYTAVDACNNSNVCTQMISWTEDTTTPVFTPPPFATCGATNDLGCNPSSALLANFECDATIKATNACGAATVRCTKVQTTNCVTVTRIITYTASSACSTSVCQQVFIWRQPPLPVFISRPVPESTNLGCNPSPALIASFNCGANNVVASNACNAPTFVSCAISSIVNGCAHTNTIAYTVTNSCGQAVTASQVVSWTEETTPPAFNHLPPNMNLGCNPTNIPECDATVRATAACGLTPVRVDLMVASKNNNLVLRYNGTSGAFITNATVGASGLSSPAGVVIGPDANLYVSSPPNNSVKRYNGTLGSFIDTFISAGSGGLATPAGLVFGADTNLYVCSAGNNSVKRYNGKTGTAIDSFVATGSGGLSNPAGLVFGPDGNLYVSSVGDNSVKRYNGTSGAFIDSFLAPGSGGLSTPAGLAFGPDGHLYVSSSADNSVKRYNGVTGAFIDNFIPAGSGGLSAPVGLAFGADGNLYISSATSNQVLRYNGTTGALIDAFVTAGSGGLSGPSYLVFTPALPSDQQVAVTCAKVDVAAGCVHYRTNTYTAVDPCSNTNTYVQVITWTVDAAQPMFTECPTNMTVSCNRSNGAVVNFTASATDTCDGNVVVSCTPASGSLFPQGTNTVTCVAADHCGHTNTCTFTITVEETPQVLNIELQASYCWVNFAGSLTADGDVDDTGSAARFQSLYGIDINGAGNALFVADRGAGKIKKITLPGAVVTTLVGGLDLVELVVNKVTGDIFFGDTSGTVRKLAAPGYTTVTTVSTGVTAFGLGIDSASDTLYVSGQNKGSIYYVTNAGAVTPGALTLLAGNGINSGFADGTLSAARFNSPMGIAVVGSGNTAILYVGDRDNHAIRKIDVAGNAVTTVAGHHGEGCADGTGGTGGTAQFAQPHSCYMGPDGNLYVPDQNGYTVRKVTLPAGDVTTIGGLCLAAGAADGCGSATRNGNIAQLTVDSAGNIYTADRGGINGVPDDHARVSKGTLTPVSEVVVSWPVTCLSYVLEQTPSLSPPVTWTPTSGSVVVNDRNTLTVPISPTNTFYRLGSP